MTKIIKIYHIICEGSSEEAYLNELNKYMREIDFKHVKIKPYNLRGIFPFGKSPYIHVKKEYDKIVKNKEDGDEIFIWLDNDVFKREKGLSKNRLQQKLNGFLGIKYNYENFEDFIVIHLADEQVESWHQICANKNHFTSPLVGAIIEKEIKKIIPQYAKGRLPSEIHIKDEFLQRLYKNQESPTIKFGSDFVDVIKQLLNSSS